MADPLATSCSPFKQNTWHSHNTVGIRVRRIDHRQLDRADVLDEPDGPALVDAHQPFVGENSGDKLAGKQHDQPGVQNKNADTTLVQLESNRMGGDQIQKQQQPKRRAQDRHL